MVCLNIFGHWLLKHFNRFKLNWPYVYAFLTTLIIECVLKLAILIKMYLVLSIQFSIVFSYLFN